MKYTKENRKEYYKQYNAAYRLKNKEKLKIYDKQYGQIKRLRNYDLTVEQYNNLLISQNYACYICKSIFKDREPHIDHCHVSGDVRKLLCLKCNGMLGMANDDIELLKKAIDYLIEHSQKEVDNINLIITPN